MSSRGLTAGSSKIKFDIAG
ncbi:MAG TPA: palindromic element RPE4 domain-containing protein [Rickettsia endosymbiont of Omalisus fontisbellaquei]|nr:palindromic element RPE4 domain-containing protein [Rickettsia endosymbiont of Omalisus fontisbellaquei]